MKLYSHVIGDEHLRVAANVAGVTFQNTGHHDGWFHPWRRFTGRGGVPAVELFLSGSSPYAAAHDQSEKAATWDEWGNFIAYLFTVDPTARVGDYKGVEDFIAKTRAERDRNLTHGLKRKHMDAPWLDDPALWEAVFAKNPRERLEELRVELRAERISYGELVELQGLAEHIEAGDVELLEAAGVPEHA